MSVANDTITESGAPLAGRSVVVTRAREQASSLVSALEGLGAQVVAFPVIEIVEPDHIEPVRSAIRRLETYDWVVLTSANGVERFFAQVAEIDDPAEVLSRVKVAAVGTATAERMRRFGVVPDLVPDDFRAEGLAEAFRAMGAGPGWRVLMPRAQEGREVLQDALRALGAEIEVVAVYRTVPAAADPAVIERLRDGVDAVTFTSPSTVRNFFAFLEAAGFDADELMAHTIAASIGPVTTEALQAHGYSAAVEAAPSTVEVLAAAIAARLGRS